MKHEKYHIQCDCTSAEHTLHITVWYGHDDPIQNNIFIHTFLCDTVWYKRLWYGIKYIFGYKTLYGHFGETELNINQAQELREICDLLINNSKENITNFQ